MIEQLTPDRVETMKTIAADRVAAGLANHAAVSVIDHLDKKCGGQRLRQYVEGLTDGTRHNLYEQLAGAVFFERLERYTFKPIEVAKVVKLFEALPMPSSRGRRTTKCSPCQLFEFANIFGFYKGGLRLVTDVLLFVPRKYGKTTMCAVLALYDALLGDCDAEAYISSNNYQQSQICFKSIAKLARMLDSGAGHFRIVRDTIEVHLPGRESLIRSLPHSPDKLDGLKASMGIYDELAQADSFDQKNVIKSSMGTRSQPLIIDITTASAKTDAPFVEELESYKRMLRGEQKGGERVFAHIFEPDLGDDEGDEATWWKVHPHLGVTVNLQFYRDMWGYAQTGYDNLKEFRTKQLNKFVQGEEKAWYDPKAFPPLQRPFTWSALRETYGKQYGVCAVDLSVHGDLSAATYMSYDAQQRLFYSKTQYFLPEGSVLGAKNQQLYEDWVAHGWLTLLPGNAIDPAKIADYVADENHDVVLRRIGYDPYKSKDFVNAMNGYGAGKVLSPVRQTISNFTAAVGKMELLIDRRAIVFDGNPITPWCFCNAILAEDSNGNCKPMKRCEGSPLKIDGAITNLMCLILFAELGIG